MTDIDLGRSVAWKVLAGAILFGGGGVALCVVSLIGMPGRDPSQRAIGVAIGAALILVGVAAFLGMRKSGLRARITADGLAVGEISLRWAEVTRIGLDVEKRWVGRATYRFYTLTFTVAGERPDLETWREGAEYHYALGQSGRAGRRLDRELRRAGERYTGMRDVTA